MSISVIIPCYNSEKWIAEAVNSVLKQSTPAAEVIVVNDGSTDGSRSVLGQFEQRLHIVDRENGGLGAARNSGAAVATSEWLAFLDADDLYDQSFICEMQQLQRLYPIADMLFSDHNDFSETEVVIPSNFRRFVPELREVAKNMKGNKLLIKPESRSVVIAKNGAFAPSCLVVRRTLFEQLGGFVEGFEFLGVEDLDFYCRAVPAAEVAVVDSLLLLKRAHGHNMTVNVDAMRQSTKAVLDRAEELCGDEQSEVSRTIREKRLGFAEAWGRQYKAKGQMEKARESYLDAIRLRPLRLRNWIGLLTCAARFRRVELGQT